MFCVIWLGVRDVGLLAALCLNLFIEVKEKLAVAGVGCNVLLNEMDTLYIWQERDTFNYMMLKGTK